jgi:hypothetical protein
LAEYNITEIEILDMDYHRHSMSQNWVSIESNVRQIIAGKARKIIDQ